MPNLLIPSPQSPQLNYLLAALPVEEFERLSPNFQLVPMPLGEILYEWNQLGEASDFLSRGLERAELGGDVRAMIAGYLLMGRLKLAEGDCETTAGYLERARPLIGNAPFPELDRSL